MKQKIYLKKVKKNRICCNDENGNKCFFLFNSVHPCLKRYIQCESEHIIFLQAPKPPTIVKWGKGSGSITIRDFRCQVNDRFNYLNIHVPNQSCVYVIKGAWSGKYPNKSTCFMMREDGVGHAYAGIATQVKDVWDITEEEFREICGGHPEWFEKIC
jgi:hypothetical protein